MEEWCPNAASENVVSSDQAMDEIRGGAELLQVFFVRGSQNKKNVLHVGMAIK